MIIVGIVLSVFGIGFFCWLLFALAVYALPFFAGTTAGLAAFHSGSGVVGALIVGVLAGGATLAIRQIVIATVRMPLIRAVTALIYAVPATIAGYHAILGLAHIGVPSEGWREVFAVVGAGLVGGTAWARQIPLGAKGRVDPGRTVPAAMRGMDPADLGQQGAIGRLAPTFGPATPGIIPWRRDAHHIAHDPNRERHAGDRAKLNSNKIATAPQREGLWDKFYTDAPARQRRCVEQYSIV